MSEQIFKIQRPIFTNEHDGHGPMWLVYDEDRNYLQQVVPDKKMLEAMGDDFKCYVRAELEPCRIGLTTFNVVKIIERVEDQVW